MKFLSSMDEDKAILQYDILGSEAHCIMLHEIGIITRQELKRILTAFEEARNQSNEIPTKGFEDIHEALESFAISKVGMDTAGKIQSGRSRNDQISLDIRMKLRDDLNSICTAALELATVLVSIAKKHTRTIMIMYTHLQQAQLGSFAHYLISYAEGLLRDVERLDSCHSRVNLSPLGACAIGGSTIPIDRLRTACLLGFDGIVDNSLDATSSRDSFLEYVSNLAILMTNLSRLAEDLIIWSSTEFGFIELSDQYSSTSSAMPQKKNPDPLELTRSRTSLVIGDLLSMLSMIKSLPSGYSRDLQDLKPPLFDATLKALDSLQIIASVLNSTTVRSKKMYDTATKSDAIALDLAEQLVIRKKIPFRAAHKVVGSLVKGASDLNVPIRKLSLGQINRILNFGRVDTVKAGEIFALVKEITPKRSLSERKTLGSPNPSLQDKAILGLDHRIRGSTKALRLRLSKSRKAYSNLSTLVHKYMRDELK